MKKMFVIAVLAIFVAACTQTETKENEVTNDTTVTLTIDTLTPVPCDTISPTIN